MPLVKGDQRKECCRDPQNLQPAPEFEKPGLSVRRCKVCGCRHFELSVEPGKLGLLGGALG